MSRTEILFCIFFGVIMSRAFADIVFWGIKKIINKYFK